MVGSTGSEMTEVVFRVTSVSVQQDTAKDDRTKNYTLQQKRSNQEGFFFFFFLAVLGSYYSYLMIPKSTLLQLLLLEKAQFWMV